MNLSDTDKLSQVGKKKSCGIKLKLSTTVSHYAEKSKKTSETIKLTGRKCQGLKKENFLLHFELLIFLIPNASVVSVI